MRATPSWWRSSCPGCPVSCRNGRSASGGPHCARCHQPLRDVAHRGRGRRRVVRDRRGRRERLTGAPGRVDHRTVRRGDRRRADLPAPPAQRRAAAGRPGRGDGRRGGQSRRHPRGGRAARGDARRRPAGGGRRGVDRRTTRLWSSSPCGSGNRWARCWRRRRPASPRRSNDWAAQRFSKRSWTAPVCRSIARASRVGLHPQPRRCHRTAARGCRRRACSYRSPI